MTPYHNCVGKQQKYMKMLDHVLFHSKVQINIAEEKYTHICICDTALY